MKAALFYGDSGIQIEEIPIPKVGPGQILLKVLACGICGGEYNTFKNRKLIGPISDGIVLGHEVIGEIVKGEGPFSVGERVVVAPNDGCGCCDTCRLDMPFECDSKFIRTREYGGGYSEYCIVRPFQCRRVNVFASLKALVNTEPLACCVHAVNRLGVALGTKALVIGAGANAQMLIQILAIAGCRDIVVFDTMQKRLDLAKAYGATSVLNVDSLEDIPSTYLNYFDYIVVTRSASKYFEMAIPLVAYYGKVLVYGVANTSDIIQISSREIWRKQISIIGSRSFRLADFDTALHLIESSCIKTEHLVTRLLSISDMDHALENSEGALKSMIINENNGEIL